MVTPGSSPTSYLTLSPTSHCENEGAYPAVDAGTGDVYVAYEHNWATNFFSFKCAHQNTTNVVDFVDATCLTLPVASCSGPTATTEVNITSMDAAFIPGGRGGRIVYLAPAPGAGAHAPAARAALENLARTLSIEWARHGITAVTIGAGDASRASELASLAAYLGSEAGAYFSGCMLDLAGPRGGG